MELFHKYGEHDVDVDPRWNFENEYMKSDRSDFPSKRSARTPVDRRQHIERERRVSMSMVYVMCFYYMSYVHEHSDAHAYMFTCYIHVIYTCEVT